MASLVHGIHEESDLTRQKRVSTSSPNLKKASVPAKQEKENVTNAAAAHQPHSSVGKRSYKKCPSDRKGREKKPIAFGRAVTKQQKGAVHRNGGLPAKDSGKKKAKTTHTKPFSFATSKRAARRSKACETFDSDVQGIKGRLAKQTKTAVVVSAGSQTVGKVVEKKKNDSNIRINKEKEAEDKGNGTPGVVELSSKSALLRSSASSKTMKTPSRSLNAHSTFSSQKYAKKTKESIFNGAVRVGSNGSVQRSATKRRQLPAKATPAKPSEAHERRSKELFDHIMRSATKRTDSVGIDLRSKSGRQDALDVIIPHMEEKAAAKKAQQRLLASPSPRGIRALSCSSDENPEVDLGDDTELTNIFNNSPKESLRKSFFGKMQRFPGTDANTPTFSEKAENGRTSTPLPASSSGDDRSLLSADPVARTLSEEKPRLENPLGGLSIRNPLFSEKDGPKALSAMPNTTSPRITSRYASRTKV